MAKPEARRPLQLDYTTVIGLPAGLGLVLLGQVLEGGSLRNILQITAGLIVVGGTLTAVLVSFTAHEIKAAASALRGIFVWSGEAPLTTIDLVIYWSGRARKLGFVSLENELASVSDPFLGKGLGLIVDGVKPSMIRDILELENESREEEEEGPARVFEAAGGYAPTLGILGAVLGLIQVMQHLSDPSRLGAGIAVAFVATVYGVGLANLVFFPVASKLRTKAHFEARRRQLILEGVVGITEGLNPRTLRDRLVSCSGRPELEHIHRHGRVA
jgi:chemotaxis protein MotA